MPAALRAPPPVQCIIIPERNGRVLCVYSRSGPLFRLIHYPMNPLRYPVTGGNWHQACAARREGSGVGGEHTEYWHVSRVEGHPQLRAKSKINLIVHTLGVTTSSVPTAIVSLSVPSPTVFLLRTHGNDRLLSRLAARRSAHEENSC